MVSAGSLLLLLVSASLVLSGHQDGGRALQKRGKAVKHVLTATEYASKIATALNPFIALINVSGPIINAVLGISTTITQNTKKDEMMAFLKVEFQNLNAKIDRYHTKENWGRLTDVYQKHENNIKTAWTEFHSLQKGWDRLDKNKKEDHLKTFKQHFGDKCVSSTATLHTSLTSSYPSFNTDFGKSLMDFSRCHEKIIKDFTVLIAELFYAGNVISHFLYHESRINKADQLAKYAYESASIMFKIHKHCISNIDQHVKLDVKDLIDATKQRKLLAKDIREFLEKHFNRYDWMVVAFITKSSQHGKLESWNKHILSDAFVREEKGDVTVAVAKQPKGTHSKAAQVKTAIEKCFKKEPQCQDVIKQLGSCKESVDSHKVKETFTAVHAFIDRAHESSHTLEAKEAPEEYVEPENLPRIPYIYTGKCKKYKLFPGGHFRVLIKSDEEMMKKSPCNKLQCGEKGKCVVVERTSIPVCECGDGFYGENCEESLEGYKNNMLSEKMPEIIK